MKQRSNLIKNKPIKKIKKAAEPQPPEIILFKDVVKHYPKQFQRQTVIDAVQKIQQRLGKFPTLEDLAPFFTAWGKVSGNDWSLVWLDWAVSGSINGKGQVQNGNNQVNPIPSYSPEERALAERLRAERRAERGLS